MQTHNTNLIGLLFEMKQRWWTKNMQFNQWHINPFKTSPEYTLAGVYGKCVL